MRIKISFLENELELSKENVRCIEVENKKYFYRLVDLFTCYSEHDVTEDLCFVDVDRFVKLFISMDYFHFHSFFKGYMSSIYKYIKERVNEEQYDRILRYYRKIQDYFRIILQDMEIPLKISEDLSMEGLIKLLNLEVVSQNDLLQNLLLLIDINKELKVFDIVVFVNLKQLLTKDELVELYKYAIYNNVFLLLIDSQAYGVPLEYERKNIIDENLDEFVL